MMVVRPEGAMSISSGPTCRAQMGAGNRGSVGQPSHDEFARTCMAHTQPGLGSVPHVRHSAKRVHLLPNGVLNSPRTSLTKSTATSTLSSLGLSSSSSRISSGSSSCTTCAAEGFGKAGWAGRVSSSGPASGQHKRTAWLLQAVAAPSTSASISMRLAFGRGNAIATHATTQTAAAAAISALHKPCHKP